jgi:hypothetical protein
MAHKIFGRNRLFHPGQIEILQPTDALDRPVDASSTMNHSGNCGTPSTPRIRQKKPYSMLDNKSCQ